jgi:hypothetical protein
MAFAGLNYLAVAAAAVAGFAVGAFWYGLLFGRPWMAALGKTREDFKPSPTPFIVSFVGLLVMAWVLAGIVGHLGEATFWNGVASGAFCWLGFVVTTTATNHAFQGARPMLTLLDCGHYLTVLLVMGAIIGAFGV